MAGYATLKDVAELAGTTIGTVSYVLNNKSGRYISDETRRKVFEAANQLNYIKCKGASSLKGKERKLIGILVPQFENQFFTRVVVAAEAVFAQHGYDLIICDTFDDTDRERAIIRRLLEQRVDGIIVTPTVKGVENTELVRRVGVKMVVVDRPLEGVEDYVWVTTNNYGCGFVGAEHLVSMGHTNIGYVGWNSGIHDLDARERATLDAADGKAVVHVEDGEFSAEAGYLLTEKLLREHPDITAVFYGFNIQAKGGVQYLCDNSIAIPEELSVVLIGSPEWSYTGRNNFTRVDMGDMELGRKAARQLLDLIQNKSEPTSKRIIQACTLVRGTSVAQL